VRQAQRHGRPLLLGHPTYQTVQLTSDASHQLLHCRIAYTGQLQLILDGTAQFGIGYRQLFMGLDAAISERFLQRFG